MTGRVKKAWLERRAAELCEMASTPVGPQWDPQWFWEGTQGSEAQRLLSGIGSPVCSFQSSDGVQPAQTPEEAQLLGTSVRTADAFCLNAPVASHQTSCMTVSSN